MSNLATAGELLDFLATLPRDLPVIIQKDAEGNGYSPLACAEEGFYLADTTWSGEVDWDDGDVLDQDGVRAIVLVPIN